jgi:thiol-disulfide isomerase/thioredoxin
LLAACADSDTDQAAAKASSSSPAAVAPSVELTDLAGLEKALEQRRGRGVLLNFWAIWCEPCVEELPELVEIAHEFKDSGGDVLLVSYDKMVKNDGAEAVRTMVSKFATKRGIDPPILIYDAPDLDAINERFDLPGPIPVTLAFDRAGKLVDRVDDQAGKARFAEMMRKALAK